MTVILESRSNVTPASNSVDLNILLFEIKTQLHIDTIHLNSKNYIILETRNLKAISNVARFLFILEELSHVELPLPK